MKSANRLEYSEIYQRITNRRQELGINIAYNKKNWLPQFVGVKLTPFYTNDNF